MTGMSLEQYKIPALLMAGYQDTDNKALWELHGKPMLSYVLEAVKGSQLISECVVIGPPSIDPLLDVRRVDGKPDLFANVNMAPTIFPNAHHVLHLSSDIPLITSEILDAFIKQALDSGADVIYPIITQAQQEAEFPGFKRTFTKIQDGSFTGGNAWILTNQALENGQELGQAFVHGRKQVAKVVKMLGPMMLLRMLTKTLGIRHAEARVGKLLGGLPVKGLIFQHAALGNDLDHLEQKPLFEQYLSAMEPSSE